MDGELDAEGLGGGRDDTAGAVAGDARLQLPTLARLSVPKLVVVGGWPADLFPGRQAAGRALLVVAHALADQLKAPLVVFDRSAHNPQIEESDAFNDLLRDTRRRASSPAFRERHSA